jgi:uncharacterized membrane protein YbhN (UPF0104 family)
VRRSVVWGVQAALAVAIVGFAIRTLARHWEEFRSLDVTLAVDLVPLLLAVLTVMVTYALLIEAWRRVIVGWGQALPFGTAARIWCVSNLGRYLPGKVWSVAGLAVLAQRSGVSGWAATGSAVAMQALAVGTGAAVAALAVPGAVAGAQVVAALAITAGVVGLLVWPAPLARLVRAVRPGVEVRPLAPAAALLAGAATVAGWVAYGVAFWLLGRGLLPGVPLPLPAAIGVFAGGYVLGLLAIFAPGGLGVRELVFVAILAPRVGSGSAVALAVGSRLLLTLTELGAALLSALIGRRAKEQLVDTS